MNTSPDFKTTIFDSIYTWQQQQILSANVTNYIARVKAELELTKNLTGILPALNLIKSEVNADNNLTVEEKQAVKIGISVAAHSSEYWLPVEYGGNRKGYAFLVKPSIRQGNGTPTLAQARAGGGHIAGSDAVGGCVGGIGFCISACFGPVGVGAYVFALGFGAASASLCTWAGL